MATLVLTSAATLWGTGWTGTAPGPANPIVSGTISSSTDLSDHISQVSIDLNAADVDFTNFGSGGYVEKKPGLLGADISIDFFNDFASSSIDSLVWTSFAAKSIVYLDVKPTSSARAATNPSYVFALYVAKYPPGGFQIGNAATTQVGFMIAGKYARLTS